MTMYQSLRMALVSLPFCVRESWGLSPKEVSVNLIAVYVHRSLITD